MVVLHLHELNLQKNGRKKNLVYVHNSFLVSVADNLLKWQPSSLRFDMAKIPLKDQC